MLEKQQLRMNIDEDYLKVISYLDNPPPVLFKDSDDSRVFEFFYEDWEDMGSPKVITVTVEPGDKLNKPLRRGIDFLTPNQIRDGLR